MGTQKVSLRFDHQVYGNIVRKPDDSIWAGREERYSTHAGLEFHGISWVLGSHATRCEV